jgi:hypothetical protein
VVLYTCSLEKAGGGLPALLAHPCGRAAKALDDAGHQYEIKQVKGGSLRFWTWPSRAKDRAEVERLSGQRGVPILVLGNGEVISGTSQAGRGRTKPLREPQGRAGRDSLARPLAPFVPTSAA